MGADAPAPPRVLSLPDVQGATAVAPESGAGFRTKSSSASPTPAPRAAARRMHGPISLRTGPARGPGLHPSAYESPDFPTARPPPSTPFASRRWARISNLKGMYRERFSEAGRAPATWRQIFARWPGGGTPMTSQAGTATTCFCFPFPGRTHTAARIGKSLQVACATQAQERVSIREMNITGARLKSWLSGSFRPGRPAIDGRLGRRSAAMTAGRLSLSPWLPAQGSLAPAFVIGARPAPKRPGQSWGTAHFRPHGEDTFIV